MIRTGIAFVAVAIAVSTGYGQALTASETEVDMAFKYLRSEPKVFFRLAGNEYLGTTTTPIASNFFWDRPALTSLASQDMRMELLEGRNGIWTNRVVADGRHVWGINLLRDTYSTARYGSYSVAKPEDYEHNGLQSLNVYTTGQSSLLARMAREIWAGIDAIYRPWIPASANRGEFTVTGSGGIQPDPVVPTREYVSSDAKKFHMYWLSKAGTYTRSLVFELNHNSATDTWKLGAIYYSDVSKVGATTKLVDWKVDVYTGALPTAGNFTYTPSATARAVASPRPNGGG